MRVLILLFNLVTFIPHASAGQDIAALQELSRQFCSAEKPPTAKITMFPEGYFESVLFRDFSNPRTLDAKIDEILSQRVPDPGRTDEQSLRFALALVFSRSEKFELFDSLTSTPSSNLSYEGHRLLLRSTLFALKREWRKSDELFMESLRVTPVLDTSFLYRLFDLQNHGRVQKNTIEAARGILERKRNASVKLRLTDAALKYLATGPDPDSWTRYEELAKSYEDCPNDEALAELFSEELIRQLEFLKAQKILSPLVIGRKHPSATAEFLYAQVEFRLGNYSVARTYLEKLVAQKSPYLGDDHLDAAKEYLAEIVTREKTNRFPVFVWIGVVILLLTTALILRRFFSRRAQ